MESIVFLVQGSEAEPYKVNFIKQSGKLNISCTCQAAINGLSCKHRLRILAGDKKDIISDNLASLEVILDWLPGSDIEKALKIVGEAERNHEQTKKELEKAKKSLAKILAA